MANGFTTFASYSAVLNPDNFKKGTETIIKAADGTLAPIDRMIAKFDALQRVEQQRGLALAKVGRSVGLGLAGGREDEAVRAIETHFAKIKAGIEDTKAPLGQFNNLLGSARTLLASFGVALSVGAVVNYGQALFNTAANLGELAQQAGVGVEELQAYRAVLLTNNISQRETDTLVARLTRSIGENNKAFAELGITGDQLARGTAAVLPLVAQRLLDIQDGSRRAAIETDIFGRTGQKLEAGLRALAVSSADLVEQQTRLGNVIGKDVTDAADKAADRMTEAWVRAGVALTPYATAVANLLANLLVIPGAIAGAAQGRVPGAITGPGKSMFTPDESGADTVAAAMAERRRTGLLTRFEQEEQAALARREADERLRRARSSGIPLRSAASNTIGGGEPAFTPFDFTAALQEAEQEAQKEQVASAKAATDAAAEAVRTRLMFQESQNRLLSSLKPKATTQWDEFLGPEQFRKPGAKDQFSEQINAAREAKEERTKLEKEFADDVERLQTRSLDRIRNEWTGTFADVFGEIRRTGEVNFGSMAERMLDTWSRMLEQMAAEALSKKLFGPPGTSGGGSGGGIFSSLVNAGMSLFGGGSPAGAPVTITPSQITGNYSGTFAEGGTLRPGTWGWAGEEGPEPIYAGASPMTVFPNQSNRGGDVTIINNIDARGSNNNPEAIAEEIDRRVAARFAQVGPHMIKASGENVMRSVRNRGGR